MGKMLQSLGERIKEIRVKLHLSQQEFAELIGVKTKMSISNFEKNERSPSFENLISIAKLGNVTVDWLLTGKSLDNKELRQQLNKKDEYIGLLKKDILRLKNEIAHLNKIAREIKT
jgi:transcriptional regulator with XRE-family HTH domain